MNARSEELESVETGYRSEVGMANIITMMMSYLGIITILTNIMMVMMMMTMMAVVD